MPVSDIMNRQEQPKVMIVSDEGSEKAPSGLQQPLLDRADERRLLRTLDFRILPVLWILYLVNFIDRANIGNAKIQGMEQELVLTGQRFNIAVWVFNLGYLVAGVPLMAAFHKYGPKSLCVMMFCWGITVIGCGLVKRWEELVVCRLLEGMAEAAFIAGSAYIMSVYYKSDEYLIRFVIFCTAGIIAGAINGFLSSLIARMDGTAGYGAWRWIFIVEGCITILISLAAIPLIVPFPEDCTFLDPDQKEFMLARVQGERGHIVNGEVSIRLILEQLKDWKIWTGIAMNLGATENANSLSNFQPTILRGLGYTAVQAQVHTIPVYITGAAFSLLFAYISARFHKRYVFYLLGWAVLATGLVVEFAYPASAGVRYMGMFFIACGCYLAMPISIVWVSINAGTGFKRSVAIAAVVNFGTAGAFVGSNVFLKREEPRFRTGFSTGLGLACMGAAAATVTFVGCRRENKRRDGRAAERVEADGLRDASGGDRNPAFRFVL